jgi:hypothetical protein
MKGALCASRGHQKKVLKLHRIILKRKQGRLTLPFLFVLIMITYKRVDVRRNYRKLSFRKKVFLKSAFKPVEPYFRKEPLTPK